MPDLIATGPESLGYIVLIWYSPHNAWNDDWDGEVHADLDAGRKSLAEAREAGWKAVLVAAVPVDVTEGGSR